MNNKTRLNAWLFIGIAVLLFAVVFWGFINHPASPYLLIPVFATLILGCAVVRYSGKHLDQIVIDIKYRNNIIKRAIPVVFVIVIATSFLIPKEYHIITIGIILTTIVVRLFIERGRYLVIDVNGIKNVFRWSLKWKDIDYYRLDKKSSVLYIYTKDGMYKQISGLYNQDYTIIAEKINLHIKRTDSPDITDSVS